MNDCTVFVQFQNSRSPEEHMVVLPKIKDQIRCFNSTWDVQRYEKIMRLKDYLVYRLQKHEYEANLAAANDNAEELRSKYVKDKLNKFDAAEENRAEQEKWGWSPLYRIFKEWSLSNFPQSPWAHTQEEWASLEAILMANVSSEPLSLELECPHIIRAFLVLFRTLHGHTRPLAHLDVGLTLQSILDFAVDTEKSVALTHVVHNLAATGWASFPGIHSVVDNFSNLHLDTVGLLGYNPKKQVAVVEKIRAFVGIVAHRAVCDMVRMGRSSELEDMWFAPNVLEQRRTKCDEVKHTPLSFIVELPLIFSVLV